MTDGNSKASLKPTSDSAEDNDTAAGFGKKRTNDRRCVATRAALAPGVLALRFVADPQGELVLDLKGSLPGRGAWLSPTRQALIMACQRGAFGRALKSPVRLPHGDDSAAFADRVEGQLERAALQRLGLCRKAGHLAIGHDQVRKAAAQGLAYLTPTDASPQETEKLARFLAKSQSLPHLPLPADRVKLSGGLDHDAVHLLVLRGGPSRSAMEAVRLWHGFSLESRG